MQTTAKTLQLLDASGINISPITDLTSLYYEIERPNDARDASIIARKYIYSGFPVGVYIDPDVSLNIGTLNATYTQSSTPFYKVVDNNNQDIIVSNISTSIIPGTTYRQLNIKNFNLSEILKYYTPRQLCDTSISKMNSSIAALNSSVNELYNAIITESITLSSLLKLANRNSGELVPNKFYLISNYGTGDGGCMDIPNVSSPNPFSGDNDAKILVRANTQSSLDYKIYEIYKNNQPLHIHGTYIINGSGNTAKLRITYLKDQYGNEAPYDFYNLKYNNNYTFEFDGNNALLNNSCIIKNNIIKNNPFITFNMSFFVEHNSNKSMEISDNYFGVNTNINVVSYCTNNGLYITNTTINSSNNICVNALQGDDIYIKNMLINNNNIININVYGNITYKNITISNNNNITFTSNQITNLTINSSNKLVLANNINNGIILNNCDGSINLSDNIVVDNYISSNTLTTTPNSVYLFGQNVYAKSFNTFK